MVLFGLVMVYSSSFIYAQERMGDGFALIRKQVIYSVLGFFILAVMMRLDYKRWERWAYWVLGSAIFLLLVIMIPGVGQKVGGARRWISLSRFRFQPGEFAKFAVIIFSARQLAKRNDQVQSFKASVLAQFILPLPALILLLLQPDFGTTIIISAVIFALMFLAGIPSRFLAWTVAFVGVSGIALTLGTSYRRNRLMTFIDPWSDPSGKGFQILQSFVGLHEGRFFGVGLGNGKEKLFYLPEAHNDFIFSVIGEELGFLGILFVVATYLYFIYRGLRIAWNCQIQRQDRFGMFLAAGITLALGFQGLINMLVALGMLPTKGFTLPLISYGGSALVVDLFAIGILLSVGRGLGQRNLAT